MKWTKTLQDVMSIYTKKLKCKISMFVTIIFGGHNVRSPFVEFRKLGMLKDDSYSWVMGLYVKYWTPFWSRYQKLSHERVMFFWKAFGLLAIGELIMNAHPFILLLMLTLKIMSSFHTMGLEAYALLWTLLHTRLFVTWLLVILFLCDL